MWTADYRRLMSFVSFGGVLYNSIVTATPVHMAVHRVRPKSHLFVVSGRTVLDIADQFATWDAYNVVKTKLDSIRPTKGDKMKPKPKKKKVRSGDISRQVILQLCVCPPIRVILHGGQHGGRLLLSSAAFVLYSL